MPTRSVAKADVAELSAALDSAVDAEKEHHLIIVGTNKVLSTTQFKQMFYSRGDDFFQIANVYECPDSCNSVHSSVWGIDCKDPHNPARDNATGLETMDGNRLTGANGDLQTQSSTLGYSSGGTNGMNGEDQQCFNFNKLGGRENDPKGCAWAYSYAHDADRNFYAQHEVMGYLEKDTCVKRDFWTACSRMSIEDQLYGLAFASETDQDLCMAVTCARRWSEVEDALAESCTAADNKITTVRSTTTIAGTTWTYGTTSQKLVLTGSNGVTIFEFTATTNMADATAWKNALVGAAAANAGANVLAGYTLAFAVANTTEVNVVVTNDGTNTAGQSPPVMTASTATTIHTVAAGTHVIKTDRPTGYVDLFINVRVSNGHPKALDTILRVRFTVAYVLHEPSALHTWNTRASTAAAGVIQSGVVGDAPEGGKKQHEDTTVVVA